MKAAIIGAASATHLMTPGDMEFIKYVAEFGKSYGTKEEFDFRAGIFKEKFAAIEEHNSQNGSYTLGLNKFADATPTEMKKLLGYKPKKVTHTVQLTPSSNDGVNWVEKGAVTPVKNQGQCGSCWAFSTTGSVEGAYAIKHGELKSFSEQMLVDCSKENSGCNGGLMDYAFKFLETDKVMLESDYPYTGTDGTCEYDASLGVANVKSYEDVTPNKPDQLKAALDKGPVSIAIEADKLCFQFYKSGVFDNSRCGTTLDHGVLAVGYGTEDGKGYFLVKNSWGSTWGEDGYIKISDSEDNICGILSQPSYPVM